MKVRTKYDENGRVASRVVTDDNGITGMYTYTYKGDSTQPCRIGRNRNHVSELILQVDDMGREVFRMDEENQIQTTTLYGCNTGGIKNVLKEEYGVEIEDEYISQLPYCVESISYSVAMIEDQSVLLSMTIVEVLPEDKYLDAKYRESTEIYFKKIKESGMGLLHELPTGDKIVKREHIYQFENGRLRYYNIKSHTPNYLFGMLTTEFNYDGTKSQKEITEFENFDIDTDKYSDRFIIQYLPDGKISTRACVEFVSDEFPLIPKASNLVTYITDFDGMEVLLNRTTNTTIEYDKDNDDIIHTTDFYDSNDSQGCYSIIRTVDPDTGNPVKMVNTLTGEINLFEYNDQGLMTQNIVTEKEEPKKILYKGIKGFRSDARKPATVVQKWHYTEDGKLLLFSAHNDLICNFTAFEYDEKGREIFQASFSSVNF